MHNVRQVATTHISNLRSSMDKNGLKRQISQQNSQQKWK